jgi:shikimate kinase
MTSHSDRPTWSPDSNIVLIGMPGCGKSTAGVLLAKRTARGFVDTDVLIEVRESLLLQDILDRSDFMNLRRIEQEVLLALRIRRYVIATGGSAAYSEASMRHLKKSGLIVFLDVPFDRLAERIRNLDTRGIACPAGMTLRDIYRERYPLYTRWADIVIPCGDGNHEEVVDQIVQALAAHAKNA